MHCLWSFQSSHKWFHIWYIINHLLTYNNIILIYFFLLKILPDLRSFCSFWFRTTDFTFNVSSRSHIFSSLRKFIFTFSLRRNFEQNKIAFKKNEKKTTLLRSNFTCKYPIINFSSLFFGKLKKESTFYLLPYMIQCLLMIKWFQ